MALGQNKDRITDRREGHSIQDFLAKQESREKTPEPPRDWRTIRTEKQREVSQANEFSEMQKEEAKIQLTELIDVAVPELNLQMRQMELFTDAMRDDLDLLLAKVDGEIVAVPESVADDNAVVFPFHQQFCFGLTRTAVATFTLWDGYITHGSNAVITVAALTGITITADNQYIGIEYDTTDGSVSLYSPSTTYPVSDGQYYRKAMYKFSFDGTVAKVIRTGGGVIGGGQPIDIPSRFGDRS